MNFHLSSCPDLRRFPFKNISVYISLPKYENAFIFSFVIFPVKYIFREIFSRKTYYLSGKGDKISASRFAFSRNSFPFPVPVNWGFPVNSELGEHFSALPRVKPSTIGSPRLIGGARPKIGTSNQKRRAVIRALRDSALTWHEIIGFNHQN